MNSDLLILILTLISLGVLSLFIVNTIRIKVPAEDKQEIASQPLVFAKAEDEAIVTKMIQKNVLQHFKDDTQLYPVRYDNSKVETVVPEGDLHDERLFRSPALE